VDWIPVAAAAVTAIFGFLGTYLANRKQTALIAYRLEVLEKKVDKHNNLVERMYKVEGKLSAMESEINDLKKGA